MLADVSEGVEPGLRAVLIDHAIGAPLRRGVVESLVSGANRNEVRLLGCGAIKIVLSSDLFIERVVRVDIDPLECAAGGAKAKTFSSAEDQDNIRR